MATSANSTNTVRIPAVSDARVIELCGELAALNDGADFVAHVFGTNIGDPSRTAAEFFDDHPDVDWQTSRSIQFAEVRQLGPGNTRVLIQRKVTQWEGNGTQRTQPGTWEGEISVLWNDPAGRPDAGLLLQINGAIERLRSTFPAIPGGDGSVLDVLGTQLAGLTDLHNKIVRDAERARQQREREFDARREAQVKEAADLRAKLEAELAAQRAELTERAAEVEAARKALDDRHHMHVRRELRENITADLKQRLQRPSVGRSTVAGRIMIFSGGVLLMALFAALGLTGAAELNQALKSPGTDLIVMYLLIGRVALGFAAVAAAGFYLLSWARQLHDADLRADRDLERYRYDIDRASWVIETIMEAEEKRTADGESPVPEEWIAGVTHGLFARSEPRDDDHAAMEALGSLLNFAAEAEIGPGGPKIKLTRRGIRQLKRRGLAVETDA